MTPGRTLALGLACLVLAQVVASVAWWQRPGAGSGGDTGAVLRQVPPGELAGTLFLGGLRGLAIDLLWLRAIDAEEDRRFYESVALFQLISQVQPRFETIWEYMAWTMASAIPAEIEDREAQYQWFRAGLERNVEGALRNPGRERLVRHLGYLFFNRGPVFADEVLATDWRPQLAPLFADSPVPLPGDGVGVLPNELAAACYDLAVAIGNASGDRPPHFARRMVALCLERAGNTARNRGCHRQALDLWLRSLARWQQIRQWAEDDPDLVDFHRRTTITSFERNEGRLRRKAADLARALAANEALAVAIEDRQTDRFDELWRPESVSERLEHDGRLRWFDEIPPEQW